ncbi:glycerophosphodiester phosphodiesterase [Paenibacillus sp. J2TS4]|uniref:glycerophosphodiester phosphodiesterase n=1 Tax=Paenibacillus sp. J2TS4 TaxID=2807194 RepID=UPI001B2EB818|nr:glycerophosphodiester phosphodiesterase [Paenibacillus sp. J2TS4]GIP32066.1 glycerophosphoryl diester phosphodiesterase [Paenibacillus sp. J2TS4]
MHRPKVAAHTGSGKSPANTLASFLEGIQSGAQIVEVDALVCKGGTVVLLHDDVSLLHQYTYEELNRPDIRQQLGTAYEKHELAALRQVLEASDPLGTELNIDLKSNESVEPTIRLIRKYGAEKRAFITGWYSEEIPERHPDIQVMINTSISPADVSLAGSRNYAKRLCQQALRSGYCGLNVKYDTCSPEIVGEAHAAGLAVWTYTVDDQQAMETFVHIGVDAITTRKPELLFAVMKQRFTYG